MSIFILRIPWSLAAKKHNTLLCWYEYYISQKKATQQTMKQLDPSICISQENSIKQIKYPPLKINH